MTLPVLPSHDQPVVGPGGLATKPWYDLLSRLREQLSADNADLAAQIAALAELSIEVDSGELTKTETDGGISLGLAPVGDNGGGTLLKTAFDSFGRVTDTSAASAADLPYDNATSGLAATEVQAAIDEIKAALSAGSDVFSEAYESWDFIKQGVTTSANIGSNFVTTGAVPVVYTAGAGAGVSLASGIATLTTGSTATGYARMYFCPPAILLGGGEIGYRTRIRIPTLSNGTERFGVGVVMANVIEGAGLQRVGAIYVDNVNSGQWTAQATNGGGTTTTNTTVAPAANTWMVLEIRPNAAGTSFELFIGATVSALASAGTVSANIPAVALGLSVQITKSVGTTARTVEVDLADFRQTFTSAR